MIQLKIFGRKFGQNWVSFIQEARQTLQSIWAKSEDAVSGPTSDRSSQGQRESVSAQLLHSALHRDEQASGNAILANFEIACFHLHVLITQVKFFGSPTVD